MRVSTVLALVLRSWQSNHGVRKQSDYSCRCVLFVSAMYDGTQKGEEGISRCREHVSRQPRIRVDRDTWCYVYSMRIHSVRNLADGKRTSVGPQLTGRLVTAVKRWTLGPCCHMQGCCLPRNQAANKATEECIIIVLLSRKPATCL